MIIIFIEPVIHATYLLPLTDLRLIHVIPPGLMTYDLRLLSLTTYD